MSRRAMFDFALKTFLFLSPVFFYKTYQLSYAQGMFFVFASFVLFGISLALKPRRRFSNCWVSLFLLLAFVRIFVGGEAGDSTQEWFNFWISSAEFIYVLAGVLLFYTVFCYAGNPKDYFNPILIVCVMNLVLVCAQLSGCDFMWKHAPSICGFMGINSQLGQYSAMSVPIMAFINPWLVLIPLFTLFAAKSVSSILAVFIGTILISWYKKWYALLLFVLIAGGVLADCNHQYIINKWKCRPVIWKKTLNAALKKPYIGCGYRSFTKEIVDTETVSSIGKQEYSRAHNDFLHTAQELGFPIVIVIYGFFYSLWKKFKAKLNKDKLTYFLAISIFVSAINMCGQTFIRYASMAGTWVVILAFLSIKLQGEKNGNN